MCGSQEGVGGYVRVKHRVVNIGKTRGGKMVGVVEGEIEEIRRCELRDSRLEDSQRTCSEGGNINRKRVKTEGGETEMRG